MLMLYNINGSIVNITDNAGIFISQNKNPKTNEVFNNEQ